MKKRSLALQRMGPHRNVCESVAPQRGAVVARVGPTPRRVARSVDTMGEGSCTDTMRWVDRCASSCFGRQWPSPRGQALGFHTAPRTSGPILRRPKDFVDQRQSKLQGIGDVLTVVASRLQRLDARKSWRINGSASIVEAQGLPWPPTLGFRGWLCESDVFHPPSLPRCCTCLSLSHDRSNPVAVHLRIIGSILAPPITGRPSGRTLFRQAL